MEFFSSIIVNGDLIAKGTGRVRASGDIIMYGPVGILPPPDNNIRATDGDLVADNTEIKVHGDIHILGRWCVEDKGEIIAGDPTVN